MEYIAIKTEPPEVQDIKPQVIISGISAAAVVVPAPAPSKPSTRNLDDIKSRCGEIFVTNNARKWTFTCTYCEKTTRDIGEFICHIQFKHMNGQYTEEDINDDNIADELQPTIEIASTSYSPKNKENKLLFKSLTLTKTNDPSQTYPLSTPTIAQVSSLAITKKNPLTFETRTNFEFSDSTNSGEELSTNASTSQHHSIYSPSTTTQNTSKAQMKQDDFTVVESVKKTTTTVRTQDDFEIYFVDENEDNGYVIIDDDDDDDNEDEMLNDLLDEEDDNEVEFIGDDDMEYNQLLCIEEKPNVADTTTTTVVGSRQKKVTSLFCNECDKYFQREAQYRSHMVKHRENTLFICQFCNKGFNSNQARNYHLKTHTKKDEYQCPLCPLSYITDNQFITHVLSHESDTCFPCMVCGKVCASNEQRDEHLKSHEKERPYGCNYCKRRFRKNNFLTNHLRKHCQYRCDFCLADFHSTQAQRRPYVCPTCEISPDIRKKVEERRSVNLKNSTPDSDFDETEDESEVSVSKMGDFSHRIRCKFCTATFVNKSNLLYHIKKKHGKKVHMLQMNN